MDKEWTQFRLKILMTTWAAVKEVKQWIMVVDKVT